MAKRRVVKRPLKSRRRRARKSPADVWINRSNTILPFPRRILTKLHSDLSVVVPYNQAVGQYYGLFCANSIYQPFTPGVSGIGMTSASMGTGVAPSTGHSVGTNPSGYTALSGIYQYYKVHKFSYSIQVMSGASSDPLNILAIPYASGSMVTNPYSQTMQQNEQGANAKSMIVQYASPIHSNTLKGTYTVRKLLGYNKVQYVGLNPILISSQPSNNSLIYLMFRWETANNTTTSAPFTIRIKLTQWVELSVDNEIQT